MLSGSAGAQVVSVIMSLVLARLFEPEVFGMLAFFIGFSTVCTVLSTWRFELATVHTQNKSELRAVFQLGAIAVLISAFIVTLIIMPVSIKMASLSGFKSFSWMGFLPVFVFSGGLSIIATYFLVAKEDFTTISKSKPIIPFLSGIFSITISIISRNAWVLIAGLVSANIINMLYLLYRCYLIDNKVLTKNIRYRRLRYTWKRYIDFPKYSLPGAGANILSSQINNIFLGVLFTPKILGYYFMAQKIVGIPARLIGDSYSKIYYNEASKQRKETGHAEAIFKKSVPVLFLIAICFGLLFFFFGDTFFMLVFGEKWQLAGLYAKLLLPLFCIYIFVSPITPSFSAFEKQKLALVFQLSLLVGSSLLLTLEWLINWDIYTFIIIYSNSMALIYLAFLGLMWKIVKKKER